MLVLKIVLCIMAVFFAKYARSLYEEDENTKAIFAGIFTVGLFIAYAVLLIINWNYFSITFILLGATAISFVVFEKNNDIGFPTYFIAAITIIAFVVGGILHNTIN